MTRSIGFGRSASTSCRRSIGTRPAEILGSNRVGPTDEGWRGSLTGELRGERPGGVGHSCGLQQSHASSHMAGLAEMVIALHHPCRL